MSLALAGRFFTTSAAWEALKCKYTWVRKKKTLLLVDSEKETTMFTRLKVSS